MHPQQMIIARLCALLVAFLLGPLAAQAVELELRVVDPLGEPLPARVHLCDALGYAWPDSADSVLMSHSSLGGYFYMPGTVTAELVPGPTSITVGHGFEWRPVVITPNLQNDTTIVVALTPFTDMRSQGWICADPHIHSHHEPEDYNVSPEDVSLIGDCEDLEQIYCLDQEYLFTGGLPHPVSTPDLVICFGLEYRNLAYGHAGFMGLKNLIPSWCCGPGTFPAFPMLSDLREDWAPGIGEGLELAHPQTGADFFLDNAWPGGGLARELPVLAALGHLDILDLASYSNDPLYFPDDWYELLDCGLQIAPAVGTDAVLASYISRPPGGYRVYAYAGIGEENTPDTYIETVKAGRTFITNYPLIPTFTVNDAGAGETLVLPGPEAEVEIHIGVTSALPVDLVQILGNGRPLREIAINGTELDTTVTIGLPWSCWLALHVSGSTAIAHAVTSQLHAHTAPVYVHLDDEPPRITGAAGYFLDWIDDLRLFIEQRGNWAHYSDYLHVISRLCSARGFYTSLFRLPPEPFALLLPPEGETLYLNGGPLHFEWEAAIDPELGDRLTYCLQICADSVFTQPFAIGGISGTVIDIEELSLTPDQTYWWRVWAVDLGGNQQLSVPAARSVFLSSVPWSGTPEVQPDGARLAECRLAVWPNPARGSVWFALTPAPAEPFVIEIFDAQGRRVAGGRTGGDEGPTTVARGIYQWPGVDQYSRPLPTGCYWIRLTGEQTSLTRPVLILR